MITPKTRRAVLAAGGAVAAGFSIPRRARAAEFTMKLGTDVPDAHPINIHARKASDAIREQTNGRVDLQIFSNNQLGGKATCCRSCAPVRWNASRSRA